jgi:hypothetical protein
MITIAERVAKGAQFLDEHDPDWWKPGVERAIDLEALDLGHGGMCILGQRCPLEDAEGAHDCGQAPYHARAAAISGLLEEDAIDAWAADLGFQAAAATWGRSDGEYDTLTAEWRRFITERRAAA